MSKTLLYFLAFLVFWEVRPAQSSVDSLKEVNVHEIFVLGNRKTKSEIILRELSIKKGDTYQLDELKQISEVDREKIYNLNLFNEVEIQVLETSDEQVDLLVQVDERWYFYPAPILEIADRNLMDWLVNRKGKLNRFNYGLRVDQFNFRGRGEQIRFIGQLGFERRFFLRYSIPYIEKSQRHGLIFDAAYNEREDMPYITDDHLPTFIEADEINRKSWMGAITHTYRPSFYNFHNTAVGYHYGHVSDTIVQLNPNYFGNSREKQQYFRLSYTYINDLRNKRTFPTKGHYFKVIAEKLGLGIFGDLDVFSIQGTYNLYTDLGNNFFLANGVIGLASFPKQQPYFNYQGLGYYEIFSRGFELDVIEGPSYILSKNSIRKLLFQTQKDISKVMPIRQFSKFKFELYGKFFTDFSWVDNYPQYEINSRLTNRFLYSVGFGLDMVTMYDLVLRLEYSYNAQNDLNFALNIRADI